MVREPSGVRAFIANTPDAVTVQCGNMAYGTGTGSMYCACSGCSLDGINCNTCYANPTVTIGSSAVSITNNQPTLDNYCASRSNTGNSVELFVNTGSSLSNPMYAEYGSILPSSKCNQAQNTNVNGIPFHTCFTTPNTLCRNIDPCSTSASATVSLLVCS